MFEDVGEHELKGIPEPWHRAMWQTGRHLTHYSLLRTLEDGLGLGYLGGAKTALALTGIWKEHGRPGTATYAATEDDVGVPADRSLTWTRVGSILIVVAIAAVGLRPAIAEELAETAVGRESTESADINVPAVKKQPSRQLTASPPVVRRVLLGHSALGRSIFAFELGDPTSRITMLVVGCIHGDECAGIAIARSLISAPPPSAIDLWVIPDLNPDGFAGGTRQNGRGVDLNRNFRYRWRPLGRPGSLHYSGTGPLSEPEARIASRLIGRVRPRVSVWFHQPLGLVDLSGGDVAIERRFARLVGLPLVRLRRYPGSVATWQNHHYPLTTAFAVELPTGALSPTGADRYADAVVNVVEPGAA